MNVDSVGWLSIALSRLQAATGAIDTDLLLEIGCLMLLFLQFCHTCESRIGHIASLDR